MRSRKKEETQNARYEKWKENNRNQNFPPKKDDVYNLCFQLSKIIKGDPGHIRESNPSPKSPPPFPNSPDHSKKFPLPK